MIMPTLDIPLLVSASALLTFCLFLAGISRYLHQRAEKRRLVGKIQQGGEYWDGLTAEGSPSVSEGVVKKPILNFLNSLGKRVAPDTSKEYSRMRIKFLRAGLRQANILTVFWGAKSFLAFLLPACFLLLRISVFRVLSQPGSVSICVILALLGFYLPDIWLGRKIARRKNKVAKGIPDALDLLVVCVEAGMGLDAAINRVGEEIKLTNNDLSEELKLLNLELRAGKSRQDALRALAVRTDIEDLSNLVTLLIQTDKFGTDVVRALRVYSDSFRTKRQQRAEEIAAGIPTKLIFPMVFCFFIPLFSLMVAPAFIQFYQMVIK